MISNLFKYMCYYNTHTVLCVRVFSFTLSFPHHITRIENSLGFKCLWKMLLNWSSVRIHSAFDPDIKKKGGRVSKMKLIASCIQSFPLSWCLATMTSDVMWCDVMWYDTIRYDTTCHATMHLYCQSTSYLAAHWFWYSSGIRQFKESEPRTRFTAQQRIRSRHLLYLRRGTT